MFNATSDTVEKATTRGNIPRRWPRPSADNMWSISDRQAMVATIVRFADIGLIALAGVLSFDLRNGMLPSGGINWLEIILAGLLGVTYFERAGLYRSASFGTLRSTLPKLVLIWSAVAGALILLDYTVPTSDESSRNWLVGFFLLALGFLLAIWVAVGQWLAHRNRVGAFAAIVAVLGFPEPARHLVGRLAPRFGNEMRLAGMFELGKPGEIEELVALCRTSRIDEVLVALPLSGSITLDIMLRPLRNLPINVKLVPEMPDTTFACLSVKELCGIPAVSIMKQPLTGSQVAIKRAEDVLISLIALIVAAPVMLLVAILIKLDSRGPVLFRQARWGFNSNTIDVLKFRTMRVDAGADPAVIQAQRDDPRVTRIGKLLRKTSLDELPQLINVLRGTMSLVGPRPHAIPHNEHYAALIDNYLGRHRLRPGITGLAQVNGARGITDTLEKMQRRVEFDLMYIDNWSLRLDLKILFRTLLVGFSHPNAF